jgi:uncharacterized protein YdeI (YjbR/CyaY-like superfamily)
MGGTGLVIGVLKEVRSKLGKNIGDELLVTLERDEQTRAVEVPEDLLDRLRAEGLIDEFEKLSYTRRKEIARGVGEAKKPETRQRRIDQAIKDLGGSS